MIALSLPEAGCLDLHSHLLPGIDDGCRHFEESLTCIRAWHKAGFRGAVCTPHVGISCFPDNKPAAIGGWVADLEQRIDEAGLEFRLWPGGELRLGRNTVAWLKAFGVPTLGPGRAVLTDWWGSDWPRCCDAALDYLLGEGYQPILAHPERMGLEPAELDQVLDCLESRGVLLQGNLNSLWGGEGTYAQQVAERLLRAGRYFLLASDTHRPDSVPGRQRGLARLRETFGEQRLEQLLVRRPREVLVWGLRDAAGDR